MNLKIWNTTLSNHLFENLYRKGAFNNYVYKKRGREGQPKVHACPLRGGLEYPRVPKNIHTIALCTVMGSKKK